MVTRSDGVPKMYILLNLHIHISFISRWLFKNMLVVTLLLYMMSVEYLSVLFSGKTEKPTVCI